jgi:hypothetical protein
MQPTDASSTIDGHLCMGTTGLWYFVAVSERTKEIRWFVPYALLVSWTVEKGRVVLHYKGASVAPAAESQVTLLFGLLMVVILILVCSLHPSLLVGLI